MSAPPRPKALISNLNLNTKIEVNLQYIPKIIKQSMLSDEKNASTEAKNLFKKFRCCQASPAKP